MSRRIRTDIGVVQLIGPLLPSSNPARRFSTRTLPLTTFDDDLGHTDVRSNELESGSPDPHAGRGPAAG